MILERSYFQKFALNDDELILKKIKNHYAVYIKTDFHEYIIYEGGWNECQKYISRTLLKNYEEEKDDEVL